MRDCLRGAGRVGTHLSGGLDSSSVAVLAARELRAAGRRLAPGFVWHPPPPTDRSRSREESLEYDLIDSVYRQEGIEPVWCPPTAQDWLAFLRSDVTLGQVAGIVGPELAVQRRAAELGVRVLLSGWGGDEAASFNGSGYHEELLLGGCFAHLYREVSARTRHPLAYIVGFVALPLAVPGALPVLRDLRRRVRSLPRVDRVRPPRARRHFSVRSTQLHLLQLGHIGQRAEGWAESGARRDIEYRNPLLDRRLLDFATSLSGGQYRRGPWNRWLMRHALRAVLPQAVCWNRRKADPVRVKALERPLEDARKEACRILASRFGPWARGRYVDVPDLIHALATPSNLRDVATWNALRLLDF